LIGAIKEKFKLSAVFTGQKIILDISGGYSKFILAKVNRIEIIENPEQSAVISWNVASNSYLSETVTYKLIKHTVETAGTIESSVSLAMQEEGIGKGAINDFLNLFSFDTDFQRDIRKGDKFDIVYNKFTDRDGNDVRSGDILVAELSIQGTRKRYYRYVNPTGKVAYYNYEGRSEQKALLKTPIAGARLSSGFGRRRHPVLGFTKLHAGTDFAAPRGTPIFSAGDGTIEIAGRQGTFGIYVRIRHNGVYKTAYAHMRALALGVRSGVKVKQGQIIGYVGTTGRSTGPHLHYEVWKSGRPINSQRMRLASRKSLSGSELSEFKAQIKPLLKNGI
jgi:murein DD-endopeptidase MepM/ murein hydrolase activator NlpD